MVETVPSGCDDGVLANDDKIFDSPQKFSGRRPQQILPEVLCGHDSRQKEDNQKENLNSSSHKAKSRF